MSTSVLGPEKYFSFVPVVYFSNSPKARPIHVTGNVSRVRYMTTVNYQRKCQKLRERPVIAVPLRHLALL